MCQAPCKAKYRTERTQRCPCPPHGAVVTRMKSCRGQHCGKEEAALLGVPKLGLPSEGTKKTLKQCIDLIREKIEGDFGSSRQSFMTGEGKRKNDEKKDSHMGNQRNRNQGKQFVRRPGKLPAQLVSNWPDVPTKHNLLGLHGLCLEGSSKVILLRKTLIQRDKRIYSPTAFAWVSAWSPWQRLLLLLWA